MRLRIYLVEDNPVIRDALTEALEELAGARVIGSAATEAEASRWLAAHKSSWDLAVVDLFLLEGSGMGVLRRCKDRHFRQKVVLLTNYATPSMREQALTLGADAFFDKSHELDEFMLFAVEEVERAPGETRW